MRLARTCRAGRPPGSRGARRLQPRPRDSAAVHGDGLDGCRHCHPLHPPWWRIMARPVTGETDRQRLSDALVLADRQRVEAICPGPKARAQSRHSARAHHRGDRGPKRAMRGVPLRVEFDQPGIDQARFSLDQGAPLVSVPASDAFADAEARASSVVRALTQCQPAPGPRRYVPHRSGSRVGRRRRGSARAGRPPARQRDAAALEGVRGGPPDLARPASSRHGRPSPSTARPCSGSRVSASRITLLRMPLIRTRSSVRLPFSNALARCPGSRRSWPASSAAPRRPRRPGDPRPTRS